MPRTPTTSIGDWGVRVVWLAGNRPGDLSPAGVQGDEAGGDRAQVERSTGSEQREQSGTRDSLRLVGRAGQRLVSQRDPIDSV
jgi:hypothetical protein